jgi:hypothetical protein
VKLTSRHHYQAATCPVCNSSREWWLPRMTEGDDTRTVERGRQQAADWLRYHPCRRAS